MTFTFKKYSFKTTIELAKQLAYGLSNFFCSKREYR